MKHFRYIFAAVIALMLNVVMGSCTPVGKLGISQLRLESVSPMGFRAMLVRAGAWVDNPSKEIVFTELEGVVYFDGKLIGTVKAEPVTVQAKFSGMMSVTAELRLDAGVSALEVLKIVATPDFLGKCTVDVHGKAKQHKKAAFVVNKKRVPLKKFFGIVRR